MSKPYRGHNRPICQGDVDYFGGNILSDDASSIRARAHREAVKMAKLEMAPAAREKKQARREGRPVKLWNPMAD